MTCCSWLAGNTNCHCLLWSSYRGKARRMTSHASACLCSDESAEILDGLRSSRAEAPAWPDTSHSQISQWLVQSVLNTHTMKTFLAPLALLGEWPSPLSVVLTGELYTSYFTFDISLVLMKHKSDRTDIALQHAAFPSAVLLVDVDISGGLNLIICLSFSAGLEM